jgi:nicotinamidase/pyrazinamidase
VILEKQELDCFSNPRLAPLLDERRPERCVVYGVVTEICVRLAAFGLLKTGRRVEIVTDAVQALDENAARKMFDEFKSAGGHLTTVGAVLAS